MKKRIHILTKELRLQRRNIARLYVQLRECSSDAEYDSLKQELELQLLVEDRAKQLLKQYHQLHKHMQLNIQQGIHTFE